MNDRGIATAVCLGLLLWPLAAVGGQEVELPEGFWTTQYSAPLLAKTLVITLSPELSTLSPAERGVAGKLIQVGEIFQNLYEHSLHHQARSAYESLVEMDQALGSPPITKNLLDLYYLFKGPIARTLDNEYVPFLPVDGKVPGKNVYPWAIEKQEIEAFLAAHPEERSSLLGLRTVVRRAEKDAVASDLATLDRYPVLDFLHAGLREELEGLRERGDEQALYAVPYSVAYANDLVRAYRLLKEASALAADEDPDFADYLAHRAVDLLCDDYEAGDAAWVRGRFGNLNAQIGAYEVYDDELYAVKTFFGLSLLLKDREKSDELAGAVAGLQGLEEALPYRPHKRVQEDIPVGVYHVIADFGQARSSNTATILPNESDHARKYGRTILLRYNILTNPEIFSVARDTWRAALADEHRDDLDQEGNFYRTLWHEIGHYLGPDHDRRGRTLSEALEEDSQILEELKADLVSLYLARELEQRGYYDKDKRRGVYASGIRRVLLKNRPQREQTYGTMELMQMNFFLAKGLLHFDSDRTKLKIEYGRYHQVVEEMLSKVLSIQYEGDKAAADRFIDEYSSWREELHGAVAAAIKARERYRYVMVKYEVLEGR